MADDSQDSWLGALGVDVGQIRAKVQSAVSDVESTVDKGVDWAKNEAADIKQDVTTVIDKGEDLAKKAVGAIKDDVNKAEDWAKGKVASAAGAVKKEGGDLKLKAVGDQSGQPVPRPMESGCNPVHGQVPGPKNHLFCSTHGHVVDTDQKMIIANSIAAYVKDGVAKAVQSVNVTADISGGNSGAPGGADGSDEPSQSVDRGGAPNASVDPAADLDSKYRAAVQRGDWVAAAEYLNGFNREDIEIRLSELSAADRLNLHRGAVGNPRVGPNSQAAQMTAPSVPDGQGPNASDPSKVDSNNLSDYVLGGLASTVDKVAAGVATSIEKEGQTILPPSVTTRSLTSAEIQYAKTIYAESLDYSLITVTGGGLITIGASRTVGNDINLESNLFQDGSSELTSQGMEILIHEMGHVWQFQHQGWGYIREALWAQGSAALSGQDAYDWERLANAHVPWERWNPEAQAEAVEDYNKLLRSARSGSLDAAGYQKLNELSAYTDKMAAGPVHQTP
jgi:hypothetical protein